MAYIDVIEDDNRPFAVRTSNLTASSHNGAFDISEDANFVTIAVDRGIVTARGSSRAFGTELSLTTGQWLRFDGRHSIDRGTQEMGQVAAWRDGLIVADKEPISAVAGLESGTYGTGVSE